VSQTVSCNSSPPDVRWQNTFKTGLILLLVVAAYLPVMRAGFIWDDDDYVTQNRTLSDLPGLQHIWFQLGATPQYYPLVHTMFWIEYHFWKLNPLGYHVDNVLLHAIASVLLWRILLRLQVPGAWLGAALFSVHPVCVESVAWITERKNVLSGVFYFGAALAWLRFTGKEEGRRRREEVKPQAPGNDRRASAPPSAIFHAPSSSWGFYFLALGLFLCALLSKTAACSLPAALLLVRWWKKGKLRGSDILPLLPLFALGLGLGWLTIYVEKTHVGAQGADWALTFWQRFLIAGRALWFYAGKLVYPTDLTFIYPRWDVRAEIWWQWLFPAAAAGIVSVLWVFHKRIGYGPLVAVLFFAGTLFPALGFFNIYPMRYSYVADHFQYLACIGLIAIVGALLSRLSKPSRVIIPVLLLTLGCLTWQQTYAYRDLESIWRDTLEKNPGCWMAHNNLGEVFRARNNISMAETEYQTALKLGGEHVEVLVNLGVVRAKQERLDEAVEFYRRALHVQPNYPAALVNLGSALLGQGHPDEAEAQYRKALQARPDDLDALTDLGVALTSKKQYTEAQEAFRTVLQSNPGDLTAHINLGNALLEMGKIDEAIAEFKTVLSCDPNQVKTHSDLAHALGLKGNYQEAITHYQKALQLGMKEATVNYNLATLLGAVGNTSGAIEQFKQALKLRREYPEAWNNLGVALTAGGKPAEGVDNFKEALKLKPDYAEAYNNLAYALIQLDRKGEALTNLLQALRLKPDYPAAKQQLQNLMSPNADPSAPVRSHEKSEI
jgi:protein O-mannosyl-transferase